MTARHSLLTVAQIRAIEQQHSASIDDGTLMQRAAAAVADATLHLTREQPRNGPVVLLCGPGNNGADALWAGLMLIDAGLSVHALLMPLAAGRTYSGPLQEVLAKWPTGDATDPRKRCQSTDALDDATLSGTLAQAAVIVDGLFGIGQSRAPDAHLRRLIAAANASGAPIVAVDVPTGLDADRGSIVTGDKGDKADGAGKPDAESKAEPDDTTTIEATVTVTMIADKPGLHTGHGSQCAGRVIVADLGLDPATAPADAGTLLTAAAMAQAFKPRPIDSNKGRFGTLVIVGGATGMTGAALLAAGGAQSAGIGKLAICGPDQPVFDASEPQWMTRAWSTVFPADTPPEQTPAPKCDAVVLGCGLGVDDRAVHALTAALHWDLPLVVDADALTLLAKMPALRIRLATRRAVTVLTPHPLEAARLLDSETATVQHDRIAAACAIARDYCAVAVLKGAGTIIASKIDGSAGETWAVVGAGSPTLATAGSGDVLAGAIGTLLAQRADDPASALAAVHTAVWAHARAGELAQVDLPYGVGLRAVEIPHYLRAVANGR